MKRKYRFADRSAAESALRDAEHVSHLRYRLLVAMRDGRTGALERVSAYQAGAWTYTLQAFDRYSPGGIKYALWCECNGQSPHVKLYDDVADLCRDMRPSYTSCTDPEVSALHAICDEAQQHYRYWAMGDEAGKAGAA